MSVQAILEAVLGTLAGIQALLAGINLRLSLPGWDVLLNVVPTETQQTLAIVQDPDSGNAALHNQLVAMAAQLDTILADVVALGTPQQANQPVTLPSPAPSGYGGPTASATAAAVWNTLDNHGVNTFGTDLTEAGENVNNLTGASASRVSASFPAWSYGGTWYSGTRPTNPGDAQYPDIATILATDATISDWLNRVYGTFADEYFQNADGWAQYAQSGGWLWTLNMSPAEFAAIKRSLSPSTGPVLAPVWPGLANVTLLDPHDITPPGENIAVACDGVIIDITGVPSWAGKFSFGAATSWRNVGAVTFTTDNGQEEFAQTFSWSSGVYMPKSQSHASGYAYRAAVGVSGTITPFVLNS